MLAVSEVDGAVVDRASGDRMSASHLNARLITRSPAPSGRCAMRINGEGYLAGGRSTCTGWPATVSTRPPCAESGFQRRGVQRHDLPGPHAKADAVERRVRKLYALLRQWPTVQCDADEETRPGFSSSGIACHLLRRRGGLSAALRKPPAPARILSFVEQASTDVPAGKRIRRSVY